MQIRDGGRVDEKDLEVVTKRADRPGTYRSEFRLHRRQAREIERHRLRQGRRYGGHRGGPDVRVDERIAAGRRGSRGTRGPAESLAIGAVVASDAFFPFPDGLVAAAEAGVTAVIQPGGSMRDEEVIAAADD